MAAANAAGIARGMSRNDLRAMVALLRSRDDADVGWGEKLHASATSSIERGAWFLY
jgi:hypothetical protein